LTPRSDALGLAERTRKNLLFIETAFERGEDVHVITQVANSLLMLVVFPWERHFADLVAAVPLSELANSGWPAWRITRGSASTLGDLIRRIRNATAHGHLQFSSDSRFLCEVTISLSDYRPHTVEPFWSADILASDLRDFCFRFIDLIDSRLG
jgi:HEPN pEK499 p136